MKKKNSILERRKKVGQDVKNMVAHSMATVKEIYRILDKNGLTQKELAQRLGKFESEISKWLSGTHNFTYLTVGKIEAALGERLIITVSEAPIVMQFYSMTVKQGDDFVMSIPSERGSVLGIDKSQMLLDSEAEVQVEVRESCAQLN
jgi:transcriptional regulator with XRE-family HTH domain